jgi:hypothetical protein
LIGSARHLDKKPRRGEAQGGIRRWLLGKLRLHRAGFVRRAQSLKGTVDINPIRTPRDSALERAYGVA